jgi:hypothetical protein
VPARSTPHARSGGWTCLLSVVLMILLLALGVTASVFVFGSDHLPFP